MPPLRDEAPMPDEMVDLLLVVSPLLNIVHGDKRARLHRAFVAGALKLGTQIMDLDEGRLPGNPQEVALALHRAALDLCARVGVSRIDLTEAYNAHGETGTFSEGGTREATDRCLALLALFHARQLVSVPG